MYYDVNVTRVFNRFNVQCWLPACISVLPDQSTGASVCQGSLLRPQQPWQYKSLPGL